MSDGMTDAIAVESRRRLPLRPRLPDYVLAVPVAESGVQLRAPGRGLVLNGRQSRRTFEALRPLLDGDRTVDDVQVALAGVSASALTRLLTALNDHGFLQDGPSGVETANGSAADAADAALFRRWLEVHSATAENVEASLAGKRVCVAGDGDAAASAAAVLSACCVRVDSQLPEQLAGIDLLIFAAPGLALGDALRLNRLSLESGVDYLPITFDGTCGLIGPVVRGRPGPCLHCLLLRREANALQRREERRFREWRSGADAAAPVWLPRSARMLGQWGAELALRRLAAVDPRPAVFADIYRVDFMAPAMTSHALRRVPFCPACSAAVSPPRGGRR